jgi:hypothetical protein
MNILASCECSNIFTIASATRPAEQVGFANTGEEPLLKAY